MINIEPIINPWLFYLINLCDTLQGFVGFIVVITIVGFLFYGFLFFVDEDIRNYFDEHKLGLLLKRYLIGLGIAFTIINVLLPSKSTIYEMILAQQITPRNVQTVVNTTGKSIDSGIDYLVDKIIESADKLEQRKGDSE